MSNENKLQTQQAGSSLRPPRQYRLFQMETHTSVHTKLLNILTSVFTDLYFRLTLNLLSTHAIVIHDIFWCSCEGQGHLKNISLQ